MSGRLQDKVALVTGAASGLGRAITAELLDQGACVVAGDIDKAGLADLAGDRCHIQRCDVTDDQQQADLVEAAVARWGRLDIAVANAGAGQCAPLVDQQFKDWKRIIDLCLTGTYLTLQAAARHMVLQRSGAIILMSSLNAVQPALGMTAYCAAKAGVAMLAQVAAMELGAAGVRCNAVAPGLVRTPATSGLWDLPGVIDEFADNVPLDRFTEAGDVARLVTFLSSPDAASITGTLQLVDAGMHLRRYPDVPAGIDRLLSPATSTSKEQSA